MATLDRLWVVNSLQMHHLFVKKAKRFLPFLSIKPNRAKIESGWNAGISRSGVNIARFFAFEINALPSSQKKAAKKHGINPFISQFPYSDYFVFMLRSSSYTSEKVSNGDESCEFEFESSKIWCNNLLVVPFVLRYLVTAIGLSQKV